VDVSLRMSKNSRHQAQVTPEMELLLPRPSRAGQSDLFSRIPELAALRHKVVSHFGLGCVGSVAALELARCGVNEMRILDDDFVDAATIVRWPLGIDAAGLKKVDVIKKFVSKHYPYCNVIPVDHRLGRVRELPDAKSDIHVIENMMSGSSLIVDATAEVGVQHFLADQARERQIPYLAVWATHGGWGGTVVRIVPGKTKGCWFCYKQAVLIDKTISEAAFKINDEIQPVGCGDPTFSAASFDTSTIALTAVRMVASTLCCNEANGYPDGPFDGVNISFRDPQGALIPPAYSVFTIDPHPSCVTCSRQAQE